MREKKCVLGKLYQIVLIRKRKSKIFFLYVANKLDASEILGDLTKIQQQKNRIFFLAIEVKERGFAKFPKKY